MRDRVFFLFKEKQSSPLRALFWKSFCFSCFLSFTMLPLHNEHVSRFGCAPSTQPAFHNKKPLQENKKKYRSAGILRHGTSKNALNTSSHRSHTHKHNTRCNTGLDSTQHMHDFALSDDQEKDHYFTCVYTAVQHTKVYPTTGLRREETGKK